MGICKLKSKRRLQEDCSICLQGMQKTYNQIKPCGHYFCEQCIDDWYDVRNTCPLCRGEIEDLFRYENNQVGVISKLKRVPILAGQKLIDENQRLLNLLGSLKSSIKQLKEKIKIIKKQADSLELLASKTHIFKLNGQS